MSQSAAAASWRRHLCLGQALLVLASAVSGGCSWWEARARDGSDCFRAALGVGPGLALDARLTDWVAPGVGIVTYTHNVGWLDRRVHGVWLESDVITTPRLAYEAFGAEFDSQASQQADHVGSLKQLATSSINLPNERWVRRQGVTTVEYFAFINAAELGARSHATWLTDLLVDPGDPVFTPRRSAWQRGNFEVGATILLVHARAGVNLFEFVDLIGGFVGLDLAGDDARPVHYPLEPLRNAQRERLDALFEPSHGTPGS